MLAPRLQDRESQCQGDRPQKEQRPPSGSDGPVGGIQDRDALPYAPGVCREEGQRQKFQPLEGGDGEAG